MIKLALIFAAVAASAWADVKMPGLFGDHMVLQQGMKVPVWGTADAGEEVAVSLGSQRVATKTGDDGKWKVTLSPLAVGRPLTMKVQGRNALTFSDVVAGEVWICSGQSNMEWPCAQVDRAEQEIAAAKWPGIRLFTVKHAVALTPKDDVAGTWSACSPETIREFSAVAYFFGRELHEKLRVPIGLVSCSWGGTPAEAWTRRARLEADPMLKTLVERWDKRQADMKSERERYEGIVERWKESIEKEKAAGASEARIKQMHALWPVWWDHPVESWHRPANLYNGMVAPLMPFAMRGLIWYQGETNASRADEYRTLFPALITDWREQWGQGDFPFLFVQLASFMERRAAPSDSNWARLREAQLKTLSLPHTGMAVTIDIGAANDIHPRNKLDVGRRLARWALHDCYDRADVVVSGPLFDRMTIDAGRAVIHFKHPGGGLVNKAEGNVQGFGIAGEDRNFVWADATIDGAP